PGLLWLARGLERASAFEDADLKQQLRASLASGQARLHPLRAVRDHAREVWAVAARADSKGAATGGPDTQDIPSSVHARKQIGRPLDHPAPISALAFHPEGTLLASGCWDGKVRLWDAESEKITFALSHEGPIRGLTFSGDGTWL